MGDFSLFHWIIVLLILLVAASAIGIALFVQSKRPSPTALPESVGLFFRFKTYLWCWLLFGALAGLATPVISPSPGGAMPDGYFWHVKMLQIGFGLFFGLVCAIVFTLLQNTANKKRSRGLSWAILIGTWLGTKLVFYGIGFALGA